MTTSLSRFPHTWRAGGSVVATGGRRTSQKGSWFVSPWYVNKKKPGDKAAGPWAADLGEHVVEAAHSKADERILKGLQGCACPPAPRRELGLILHLIILAHNTEEWFMLIQTGCSIMGRLCSAVSTQPLADVPCCNPGPDIR